MQTLKTLLPQENMDIMLVKPLPELKKVANLAQIVLNLSDKLQEPLTEAQRCLSRLQRFHSVMTQK